MDTGIYEYQVHLAHALRCQWGVDVASTYGPWGFAGLSVYHPDTFHGLVLLDAVILVGTALRIAVFVERTVPGARWARSPCAAASLLLLTPIVTWEWTPVVFCSHLLATCVALEWSMGRRAGVWVDALTASMLGFLALVKISAWPVVLLVGTCSWLQAGRRWAFSAWMAGSALVAWICAGQSLRHLGSFVATGVEVIAGYKNELAVWYPEHLPGALFAGAALGSLALLVWVHRPETLLALGGHLTLGVVLLQLFQAAFVRADAAHIGPSILAFLSLVPLLVVATGAAGARRRAVASLGMVACGAALVLASPAGAHELERPRMQASALLRLIREGSRPLRSAREAALLELRASHRLAAGETAGTGGIVGGDVGILEGSGAAFTLQPTFTGYAAYTQRLQELNAAWITRRDGPAWLLWCSTGTADYNYPTESDSRALVALLSHFTFVRQVGACALLRRTEPRNLVPGAPVARTLQIGHVLALAPEDGSLVWATLGVRETLRGKLVRTFLKPAPLMLQLQMQDGRTALHEVLPPMTSQGFLLSPYPSSWQALEAGARGESAGDAVSAFRVVGWSLGPSRSELFYEPEVDVTLTPLSAP